MRTNVFFYTGENVYLLHFTFPVHIRLLFFMKHINMETTETLRTGQKPPFQVGPTWAYSYPDRKGYISYELVEMDHAVQRFTS
jgi:hypothetical protein